VVVLHDDRTQVLLSILITLELVEMDLVMMLMMVVVGVVSQSCCNASYSIMCFIRHHQYPSFYLPSP